MSRFARRFKRRHTARASRPPGVDRQGPTRRQIYLVQRTGLRWHRGRWVYWEGVEDDA